MLLHYKNKVIFHILYKIIKKKMMTLMKLMDNLMNLIYYKENFFIIKKNNF